jgi:hypothetical protein
MRRPFLLSKAAPLALVALAGCGGGPVGFDVNANVDATPDDVAGESESPDGAAFEGGINDVQALDIVRDVQLDPDASCATATAMATIETLPVDIIWVVDNSSSMGTAIDQITMGLNNFASLISTRGFDYHVIMLSLRPVDGTTSRTRSVGGSTRYTVCIPPPLAGDSLCHDGPRFFQSSIDIRSTQPLEQFLGTLGQTSGYMATQGPSTGGRGGDPWRSFLRDTSTKTIVMVSDDNSRLSADYFLHFHGGANPNNSNLTLPPGILDPSWGGLFDNLTFDGLYGWDSETDPAAICHYPGGATPSSSGPVYTTLVTSTMGVRARICDGASAWGPFFDSVAMAVDRTSRIACDVAIPMPPDGSSLDPMRVNVVLNGMTSTLLGKVANAAACTSSGGWYYDDDANPTRVILCPSSCDRAQTELRGEGRGIQVQFGCTTIPG